jgi:Tol biopolymer transport system component
MLVKKDNHLSWRPLSGLAVLVSVLSILTIQLSPVYSQKYSDWSTPVNLGAVVNSSVNDQQLAISKDGLSLYFTSNRTGGFGGFDMYVSQRVSTDDPWGSPVNLGSTINTSANEGNPAFSRDGHLMFFQSDRTGGIGGIDIWVSQREHTHDDFDWGAPVNVSAGVNSSAGDQAPSYFEDDETGIPQLYFASNRIGGLGGLDIFMSEQAGDGSFGAAARITELSSAGGDSRPTIRHDGLEIIFQSDRPGSTGGADLWVSTRATTLDAWSIPVNLGNTVNTTFADNNPYLSSDGTILLFVSDRPGGSGSSDLYITTRTKLRGASGK